MINFNLCPNGTLYNGCFRHCTPKPLVLFRVIFLSINACVDKTVKNVARKVFPTMPGMDRAYVL